MIQNNIIIEHQRNNLIINLIDNNKRNMHDILQDSSKPTVRYVEKIRMGKYTPFEIFVSNSKIKGKTPFYQVSTF